MRISEHALLGDLLAFDLPPSEFCCEIVSRDRAALHHEIHEHFDEAALHELGVRRGERLDLHSLGLLCFPVAVRLRLVTCCRLLHIDCLAVLRSCHKSSMWVVTTRGSLSIAIAATRAF